MGAMQVCIFEAGGGAECKVFEVGVCLVGVKKKEERSVWLDLFNEKKCKTGGDESKR